MGQLNHKVGRYFFQLRHNFTPAELGLKPKMNLKNFKTYLQVTNKAAYGTHILNEFALDIMESVRRPTK